LLPCQKSIKLNSSKREKDLKMSASSPKATRAQKQALKDMRAGMPEVSLFSNTDMCVTVAIRRSGSDMGEFSVAITGKGELKFRPKLGKYVAMARMYNGESLPVRLGRVDGFAHDTEASLLESVANEIAYAVGQST
jgi:hypothetical protein